MKELFDEKFAQHLEERFEEFRPPVKESHWAEMKSRLQERNHGPKLIVLLAMAASTLLGMNTVSITELDQLNSLRPEVAVHEPAAVLPQKLARIPSNPREKFHVRKMDQLPASVGLASTPHPELLAPTEHLEVPLMEHAYIGRNSSFPSRYTPPIEFQEPDRPFSIPGLDQIESQKAPSVNVELDYLAYSGATDLLSPAGSRLASIFAPSQQEAMVATNSEQNVQSFVPIDQPIEGLDVNVPTQTVTFSGQSLTLNASNGTDYWAVEAVEIPKGTPVSPSQETVQNAANNNRRKAQEKANFLTTARFRWVLTKPLGKSGGQLAPFVRAPLPSSLPSDYLDFVTTGVEVQVPIVKRRRGAFRPTY